MLRVAEPAAVVDLEAHAGGLADTMQWRGRVTPASERRRVELSIDGVPTEARGDPDTGEPQSAQEPEKPCVAALSASPALVESLLAPSKFAVEPPVEPSTNLG